MPKLPTTNLSLPHLRALAALREGGALSLRRIGGEAGIAGAASGAVLAGLERQGLAERLEFDVDGLKEVTWRLTEAGQAVAEVHVAALPTPKARAQANGQAEVPEIGALIPIFGSNRLLASKVGDLLAGCAWVGIPFAGGLTEVPHIKARTVVANDLHCHIINLARVVALGECACEDLQDRLRHRLFHPVELNLAQRRCWEREQAFEGTITDEPDLDWAADYFCAAWMARSATAGTKNEFQAPLSTRWDTGGGDSVKRFQGAVAGLQAWMRVLTGRVTFQMLDAFAFLAKCKDQAKHGIYCDPPFPGPGNGYKHRFGGEAHERMAGVLAGYSQALVVCRFYDVPLVRRLYPEGRWVWHRFVGKKQSNENSPEVLITNGKNC